VRWNLSVLLFEIQAEPLGRHQLTVSYRQPAGVEYNYGAEEGFVVPGFHFAYILKIRESWASFGPIELTVRIPEAFRLRASPTLRFAGTSQRQRVYLGRLQPYRQNLYLVVGSPEIFEPMVLFGDSRYSQSSRITRFGTPHAYVALKDLIEDLSDYLGIVLYDANKYLVREALAETVDEPQGEPSKPRWVLVRDSRTPCATLVNNRGVKVEIVAGQSSVTVNGKKVKLPAPVRYSRGKLWVPLRAWVNLLNEHLGTRLKVHYDPKLGNIHVFQSEPARD